MAPPVAAPRTTIVSVSYNSADVLPAMLVSVPEGVPVVVVDNASSDRSADIGEAAGATVVRLPVNEGFGRGCNAGAALAKTEFVLFLNPDTELKPGALEALEEAADTHLDSPAFNPRIEDRNGSPYFKRSSKLLPRARWMKRGWPPGDTEVTILSGAAFFCRRSLFEEAGGYDSSIFLYHEDDDLALRMAKQFGPLRFVHGALVRHLEGRSSPRSVASAKIKSFHMGRSRVYAMRKHKRPFAFSGSLWSGVRKLLSPAVLVSARKRTQAWHFTKGVLSTIGDSRSLRGDDAIH